MNKKTYLAVLGALCSIDPSLADYEGLYSELAPYRSAFDHKASHDEHELVGCVEDAGSYRPGCQFERRPGSIAAAAYLHRNYL